MREDKIVLSARSKAAVKCFADKWHNECGMVEYGFPHFIKNDDGTETWFQTMVKPVEVKHA